MNPIAERLEYLSMFVVKFEPEDPAKHFVVRDFRVLTKEVFAQEIRDTGATSATTFEEALYAPAQIKFDTHYTGVAVAFSWPSGDNYLSYFYGVTGISVIAQTILGSSGSFEEQRPCGKDLCDCS
jgi:hypothetical protein